MAAADASAPLAPPAEAKANGAAPAPAVAAAAPIAPVDGRPPAMGLQKEVRLEEVKHDYTEREFELLRQLKEILAKELPDHKPADYKLMRFIRARKHDVRAAANQYIKQVHWRHKIRADEWRERPPEALRKLVPEAFFGHDKNGLPSYIVKAGRINTEHVRRITVNDFVWSHIWGMEYSFERCIESTHARGRLVDKFSNIVDLEGLGVKHRNLAKYVKAIAKVDEANYPETMGHTFIVNAPWIFTAMFNIIKGWLDPVTASKVFVLGSDYKETLLQHYSPEELPKEYGGTAEGEIIRVFSEEEIKRSLDEYEATFHLERREIRSGASFEERREAGAFGASFNYYFKTVDHDIKFGVTFVPARDPLHPRHFVRLQRMDTHVTPVKQHFEVYEPGTVIFEWDNKYSYWTHKTLLYHIDMHNFDAEVPPEARDEEEEFDEHGKLVPRRPSGSV